MKIEVTEESFMQTVITQTDGDSERTIEITDVEWQEFNDVEEHYEQLLTRFRQRQQAARAAAMGEIGQLRARLSQLEARLGLAPAPAPVAAAHVREASPIDETDAGQDVGTQGPWMGSLTTAELRAAHEEMRNRTAEKRRKLR